MNALEKDIPKAVAALVKYEIVKDNKYKKQFNGYISSFGAAAMQSGLLPTVVFYSSDSSAEESRSVLLCVLMELLSPKTGDVKWKPSDMYERVSTTEGASRLRLERQILEKAIAVKLALRLFQKT